MSGTFFSMKLLVLSLVLACGAAFAQTAPQAAPKAVVTALEARRKPLEDLAKVAEGRVVAFGRAAYGVAAITAIEALLARGEWALVAADVGLFEGEDVDAYVTEGKGDLEALLTSLEPWSFARAEVRALLESLREHNAKPGVKKTRFAGIGQGAPQRLVERSIEFFDKIDQDAARRCGSLMGPLRQTSESGRPRYFEIEASGRYLVQVGVGEMLGLLSDRENAKPANMDDRTFDLGLRDVRRLNQIVETMRAEVEMPEHDPRGRFLADNLREALTQPAMAKDGRVLALVHVRDLARASDPDAFAKAWGEPLTTLASAFASAEVRAYDPNALAKGGKGYATIALDASSRTELERALEHALSKAGAAVFDTREIDAKSELGAWLAAHGVLRSARTSLGSPEEAQWPFDVAADFDAIVLSVSRAE